jgi:pilus assembly protein CpaC
VAGSLVRSAFGATVALSIAIAASTLPSRASNIAVYSIQTGQSIVLKTPNLDRVAVGDPKIAGILPLGTSQVIVNGKASGHTTIFVWNAGVEHTYEITVVEQNLDSVAGLIRRSLDLPDVDVIVLGQNIILEGEVADDASFNQISAFLKRFDGITFNNSTGGNGKIVNAVTVKMSTVQALQAKIDGSSPGNDIHVSQDPNGDLVVSGLVKDKVEEEAVIRQVQRAAGPMIASTAKVVDRLDTGSITQIDVKVNVLEVDKTGTSQLGLRLQTANETQPGQTTFQYGSTSSITALENPNAVVNRTNPFAVGPFQRVSLFAPTLDLLIQQGHARELSSPNLVAMPGKEAKFLVGGQVPIPISNGLGTVTVEYKDYGVNLDVTPDLLADGSIETVIRPEVSDLDFADGIQLNGFTIPALKTSRLQTDVVTRGGESVILGGLLRRVEQKTITKIPLLADIPILGQLFRSTNYQKNDSDVIFVMTPTVVTR